MNRRVLWVGLFGAYFLFVMTPAAHAYLDPGSGSLIFQVIIGGLLGVGVAVKAFWGRITAFLSRSNRKGTTEDRNPEQVG